MRIPSVDLGGLVARRTGRVALVRATTALLPHADPGVFALLLLGSGLTQSQVIAFLRAFKVGSLQQTSSGSFCLLHGL